MDKSVRFDFLLIILFECEFYMEYLYTSSVYFNDRGEPTMTKLTYEPALFEE